MRPHQRALGITRVARQTGLDRLGIACYAAIRPNAATLAVNQGKGIDDASAEASAIMEAAEYAIAERAELTVQRLSIDEISASGRRYLDPAPLLPAAAPLAPHLVIGWVAGEDLLTGTAVLVPRDAVMIGGLAPDLPLICRSTNGLASGNCEDEAVFHALSELVERDAASLWAFKSDTAMRGSAVAASTFADIEVHRLVERIQASGFRVNLFDQTTDLGLPAILAVIVAAAERPALHFDIATGAGCHPIAAIAAIRAITEAAQTRISNIAGGRDDFEPSEYRQVVHPSVVQLARPMRAERRGPAGESRDTNLPRLLAVVKAAIAAQIPGPVVLVRLGGEAFGISVVRLFAPGLEDRLGNRNWRPGPRAAAAMLRFW